MDAVLQSPKIQLSDIFIPADEAKKKIAFSFESSMTSIASTLGEPSLILDDWLYLGNRHHAKTREMLEHLGISHILNITATIPCSFPDIIQYAHIKVFDESTVELYDYFEAAAEFIDLCNPLRYDINKERRKRRVLVHCAMGISRSASITIAYLMSRPFALNKSEQKIISHIQQTLEAFDNEIESRINANNFTGTGFSSKVFEDHRTNKDLTKRVRKNYLKKSESQISNNGTQNNANDEKTNMRSETRPVCIGLTLGEAYLFVLDRRNVICPNVGFCRQLEMWEKFVWDKYNDSTLYQLPLFAPDLEYENRQKQKNGKLLNSEQGHECKQCCNIL